MVSNPVARTGTMKVSNPSALLSEYPRQSYSTVRRDACLRAMAGFNACNNKNGGKIPLI